MGPAARPGRGAAAVRAGQLARRPPPGRRARGRGHPGPGQRGRQPDVHRRVRPRRGRARRQLGRRLGDRGPGRVPARRRPGQARQRAQRRARRPLARALPPRGAIGCPAASARASTAWSPTGSWSSPMTVATGRSAEISARHPLAPLTVEEAGTAARLALAASGPGTRLVYCALAEPPKSAVLGWDGTPLPRQAACVLYSRPDRMTWLVTVSLDAGQVVARVPVPGAQPPIMAEEFYANGELVKADPAVRAALARRGI